MCGNACGRLKHIGTRRRPGNQLGFALQLCTFRYPGRLLKAGEVIPEPVSRFVAAQLGLKPDDLLPYAAREKTRREHLDALRKMYGYRMFSGKRAKKMRNWLDRNAEAAQSSQALVRGFVDKYRRQQIILPGTSVIERHCADALVAAERRIEAHIAARLDEKARATLDKLLAEEVDGRVSRFIWLRQFEVGKNSADMNRQLERLEFLQGIALSPEILADIPAHRVAQLRRQGERYFTDGLRDITSDRRLPPRAHLASWLGTHHPHRRVSMAADERLKPYRPILHRAGVDPVPTPAMGLIISTSRISHATSPKTDTEKPSSGHGSGSSRTGKTE